MLGSGLSQFALGVWLFEKSGSITAFSLFIFCLAFPCFAAAPFAGALVDRMDRRVAVLLADAVAAVSMLSVALLVYLGRFEPWHVYVAVTVGSISRAVQAPAFAAAVSSLVPKERLGRANGMVLIGETLPAVFGPLASAWMLKRVGVGGILAIDFATFVVAVLPLVLLKLPSLRPEPTEESSRGFGERVLFGWRYLVNSKLLLALTFIEAELFFVMGVMEVLVTPLLLLVSDVGTLGTFTAIAGTGMVAGSSLLALWGGPRHGLTGVRGFLFGLSAAAMLIGVRAWLPQMVAGGFGFLFCFPLIIGCAHALWQKEVPEALQGRVFATRAMFARVGSALAYVIAGPLADQVFEPAMREGGWLAPVLGPLVGVGQGRGIGVLFIALGVLALATAALVVPRTRPASELAMEAAELTPR